MTELLVIAALWPLSAAVAGVLMGRRGHSAAKWTLVGLAIGPLAVLLVFTVPDLAARGTRSAVRRASTGSPSSGSVDVLVGVDGSPESHEALSRVNELLGPRLGRLTLAEVLDADAVDDGADATGPVSRAHGRLRAIAERTSHSHPDLVVLAGRPAEVLVEHAHQRGAALLVVGARGEGLSRAVLGSTAAALARVGDPPVLVVGHRTEHGRPGGPSRPSGRADADPRGGAVDRHPTGELGSRTPLSRTPPQDGTA